MKQHNVDRQAQKEINCNDPALLGFLKMLDIEFQRWADGKSSNEIFEKKINFLSLLHE